MQKEANIRKDDETIDADYIKVEVDEMYHPGNRYILRKHNDLWPGRL